MPKIAYIPSDQDAPDCVRWCGIEFVAGELVETSHPHVLAKAEANPDFVVWSDDAAIRDDHDDDDDDDGADPDFVVTAADDEGFRSGVDDEYADSGVVDAPVEEPVQSAPRRRGRPPKAARTDSSNA